MYSTINNTIESLQSWVSGSSPAQNQSSVEEPEIEFVAPENFDSANSRYLHNICALTTIDTSRFHGSNDSMPHVPNSNYLASAVSRMAPNYVRLVGTVSERALQAMDAQHNMFISKVKKQRKYVKIDCPAPVKKIGLWGMKRKLSRQMTATVGSAIKQLNRKIAQDVRTTRDFAKLSLLEISSDKPFAVFEDTFRILDAHMMSEVKRNITKHLSTGDVTNHSQSDTNGVMHSRTERVQNTETPYVNSGCRFGRTFAKASDDPHVFQQAKSVSERTESSSGWFSASNANSTTAVVIKYSAFD